MKNLFKRTGLFASVLFSMFVLAACHHGDKKHASEHHQKHEMHAKQNMHDKKMMHHDMKDMDMKDVKCTHAVIYSKNGHGKAVEIGTVKMHNEKNGVMAKFHVKDMRVGVPYEIQFAEYECKTANKSDCKIEYIDADTPTVMSDGHGVLSKDLWIEDMTLEDTAFNKIIFTRDNGYKAAWGMIKPCKM